VIRGSKSFLISVVPAVSSWFNSPISPLALLASLAVNSPISRRQCVNQAVSC
jgi:hypothetical protein